MRLAKELAFFRCKRTTRKSESLLLDIETVDDFLVTQIQLAIGNRWVSPDFSTWATVL